jgi:DNA excision repair protein ERCC-2
LYFDDCMAVKVVNGEIRLTVRDLLLPKEKKEKLHISFPIHQRGLMGKSLQQQLQIKKPDDSYHFFREYPVSLTIPYGNYSIYISGKIDGVIKKQDIWEIEEIKSVVLPPTLFRTLKIFDLTGYSEQLLFYCFILHKTRNEIKLKPVLTLGNLVNNKIRSFKIKFDPLEIESIFFKRLEFIVNRIVIKESLFQKRRKILQFFEYPLKEKRAQQFKMINEVKASILNREHLLISAPTGIGKTAAVLYPALTYALNNSKKVFFATSKNTQQRIVSETVRSFKNRNLELSIVFLQAARTMCLNHTFFCYEDYCPFVKNLNQRFFDSGITQILNEEEIVEPERVIHLAQTYTLCPSEILFQHSKNADCIVGDYNYVFNPSGSLHHFLMGENAEDWILIIDEAHNLYQRGLEYLSPRLTRLALSEIIKQIGSSKKKVLNDLKKPLSHLKKILDKMHEEGQSAYSDQSYYIVELNLQSFKNLYEDFQSAYIRYLISKSKQKSIYPDDPIQNFYFQLRHFIYVVEQIDDRFVVLYRADKNGALQIQCCDPSLYLRRILDSFHNVIAMSATIEPLHFYRTALGFHDDRSRSISLDSPFMNKNRKIIIVPETSTRYKHRSFYYPRYAEIIKQVISQYKGNYIAFFPSFEFLQHVNLFLGEIESYKLIQKSGMTEKERLEILHKLTKSDQYHLLLAVMGGIFSESIDLPGEKCVGIIIFSPALPKISLEREIIRHYYDQKSGNGFEYAYIYPGLNNVIQAAGRLIRSEQDRGIVVIVGERFNEDSINRLFPDYWFKNPGDVIFTTDYQEIIKSFWESSTF